MIHVALVVHPRMLSEILTDLLQAQADIELVEDPGPGAAPGSPRPPADVVILSAGAGLQAETALGVLRRSPGCKVLTLAGDGCHAALHELRPYERPLGELSPERLLQVIRAAARSSG